MIAPVPKTRTGSSRSGCSAVRMAGSIHDADRNARVLDESGWINKLGSHHTHFGTLRLRDQFVEPSSAQRVHIVIHENQNLSTRSLRSTIVHGSKVKRSGVRNAHTVGSFEQTLHGCVIPGLMLNDDDFAN